MTYDRKRLGQRHSSMHAQHPSTLARTQEPQLQGTDGEARGDDGLTYGFSFATDTLTAEQFFAELGTERNGTFLR